MGHTIYRLRHAHQLAVLGTFFSLRSSLKASMASLLSLKTICWAFGGALAGLDELLSLGTGTAEI